MVGENSPEHSIGALRIIDQKGFIKVQRGYAKCPEKTTAEQYLSAVQQLWEELAVYQTGLIARPEFYLCIGARVADFSATEFEQLQLLMELEIAMLEPAEEVIVIAEISRTKVN